MCSDAVIAVENLSKCYQIYDAPGDRLKQMLWRGRRQFYKEFWALRHVNFTVRRGETIGIIGRNGSGKSTLLQMICGTLTPTEGRVQTKGRVAALLELGSGFNPEFTGRENVYMNAALLGLTEEEITNRYADIVAFADIGDFIDRPVKTYSSGMYVRLAFAVIAHVDADVLVIDEALAVGDAFFTQKCMRFLRRFKEEHVLLFVSHDTSSVINLCDRALWLDAGELKEQGKAKDVCESYLNSLFAAVNAESGALSKGARMQVQRLGQKDLVWKDQRAAFVNTSSLRNDLEVFTFSADSVEDYGGEKARITAVHFLDEQGNALSWIVGGEKVSLCIEAKIYAFLTRPIMGFFVKDSLGQTLFGDNTYLSFQHSPVTAQVGEILVAEFEFFMPWLAQGDYVVQVAIANGSQDEHMQIHWIHDALSFRSHHSPVSTGIIGIPLCGIRLESMGGE